MSELHPLHVMMIVGVVGVAMLLCYVYFGGDE